MLKLKKNPSKNPAKDVNFDTPAAVQKQGIELLIALNTTPHQFTIGPDFGIDAKILVTKAKPHFYFNPELYTPDPKDLIDEPDDSTIHVSYKDYLGNINYTSMQDPDGNIRRVIDGLHNGFKKATKPRKV